MKRLLMHSPWRVPALLALACAGLAAVVAAEIGEPQQLSPVAQRNPQSATASDAGSASDVDVPAGTGGTFTPEPLESYVDIVERPLFQASRRPAPEAIAANGPSATPLDTSIQLAGVVLGKGVRAALVVTEGAPRPVYVEVGGDVGGWTVEEIAAERVVLKQGSNTKEITLDERMKALAAAGANQRRLNANRPQAQPGRGQPRPGVPPGRMTRQTPEDSPPRDAAGVQQMFTVPDPEPMPRPFEASLR